MENCLFCNMASGKTPVEKIYEDDHIFVIKDIHPKSNIHLLVIPKHHIDNLMAVRDQDADLLGYIMCSLKNFARELGLDSFRTVINTGSGSGQTIFHFHVHLLSGSNLSTF